MTKKKDKEETYIKNKEIDKRNKKLKELTNGYDIIWLDENEVFDKKIQELLILSTQVMGFILCLHVCQDGNSFSLNME